MSARPLSYAEAFLQYFDVCYASEQQQIEQAGRIRYRVYCEEFGYEPKSDFPDGIETDSFDERSLHCLVTHKLTALPAACVRVVLTGDDAPLPFEKFCIDSLDHGFFDRNPMPRSSFCEISRLAVDGAFRRRSGEKATRFGDLDIANLSPEERRTFPLIAVSCYLAATAVGSLAGCTRAFAMMEPFLPRLLSRSGINVRKVGKDLEYHGLRAPYFITLEEALDGMVPELRELYDAIFLMIQRDFEQ